MAAQLSRGIIDAGYKLEAETETNQVFPILPNEVIDSLNKSFAFYNWEKRGADQSVIRLVTSWHWPVPGAANTICSGLMPNFVAGLSSL